jgi:hypothetical protein
MKSIVLYLILSLLIVGGCAFPSDPPQKVIKTPPPTVVDSTLLPLHSGVGWVYWRFSRFDSGWILAHSAWHAIDSIDYYGVFFDYLESASMYRSVLVVPYLMRNTEKGLGFFMPFLQDDTTSDSPPPKLQYVLPYPASVGTKWDDPSAGDPKSNGYHVIVVAKDTAIKDLNEKIRIVYRYDISDKKLNKTSIYVLPHKAIIKIENPYVSFVCAYWIGLLDD